ncbi:RNA-directed DNA polymerase, eukaryota [Tanacetum coccineum]
MDLNEALRKPSNGLDGRAENKNAESNIRPIDDPAGHNKWRKNISYPDGFVFGAKAHDMSDKLCKCNTDGAREVNGVTEKDYNEKVEDHLVGSINRTRKKRKIVVEDTFAWGKTNEDDLEKNSSGSRRRSNHHAKKVARRRSGSGPCNGGTSYEYKSQQVSDSSSRVNVVNENNHSSGDSVCSFKSMREIGEQIGVVWDKGENHSQKDNNSVGDLRGSTNFGFAQSNAIGRSGGLLLIWDSNVFSNVSVVGGERFIAAKGNWKGVDGDVMLVNAYGAHVTDQKMALWDRTSALMNTVAGGWCLFGDFNEVKEPDDGLNTEFNARDADNFNEFIRLNSLVEIQLGGRKYTRISDDGLKFSKLDRFLVTPEFSTKWDNLSAIALDRKIFDHCPILMKDMDLDYGPNPFRVFDLWLEDGEIDAIVKDAWEIPVRGSRPDCRVRDKFKNVKEALKRWSRIKFGGTKQQIEVCRNEAMKWEKEAEARNLNDDELEFWMKARIEWVDKENEMVSVLQQKARIKWDTEGDENLKFFHAIVKRRYNKNNIRGLIIDGDWCEDP